MDPELKILYSECINTFVFGIYVLVTSQAIAALRQRRAAGKPVAYSFATVILIFLVTSLKVILRLFDKTASLETGHIRQLTPLQEQLELTGNGCRLVIFQAFGAFMIYRTCVLCGRNWITLIPLCILWTANLGLGSYTGIFAYFERFPFALTEVHLACVLSLNLECTVLISVKAAQMSDATKIHTTGKYIRTIIDIIVESASVFSLLVIFTMIGLGVHSDFLDIINYSNDAVLGIVLSFIIIRIGEGTSMEASRRREISFQSKDLPQTETSFGAACERPHPSMVEYKTPESFRQEEWPSSNDLEARVVTLER